MPRNWIVFCTTGFVVLANAAPAIAQDAWPDVKVDPFPYGPGFYLSITKLLLCWLLLLMWVYTTDWVSQDGRLHKFAYNRWNGAVFFSFVIAFILLWFIPIFWIGYPLLLLAYFIPLGLYVGYRNKRVEQHETVLTPDHIRFFLSEKLRPLGIKIDAERKSADQMGPPIKLDPRGGDSTQNGANMLAARQSPAFDLARELLIDAIARRSEGLLLDYSKQAVAVRYQVDGIWSAGDAQDRETGDAILAVLKVIANLNPRERRAKQIGEFGAEYEGTKYTCIITSQGTKTGERVLIQFDDGTASYPKLVDAGMREKVAEQVRELLAQPDPLILVSSPPGNGFTTTFDATLGSMDRFTRSFIAIEPLGHREKPVENVVVRTYDRSAGESPANILPRVTREYPDVIIVRDPVDGETLEILLDQPEEKRAVVVGVRARDSVEALLRVLTYNVPPAKFAKLISISINVRLVRKLCEECKEAYAPQPQLLKKLGLPAGKIEALYRPPQQPEEVCPQCGGVGYLGRTAIYETLIVGPELRKYLAQPAKLDVLRQVARKEGLRTLQDEGLLLVARGVTSLQELTRVLKQ